MISTAARGVLQSALAVVFLGAERLTASRIKSIAVILTGTMLYVSTTTMLWPWLWLHCLVHSFPLLDFFISLQTCTIVVLVVGVVVTMTTDTDDFQTFIKDMEKRGKTIKGQILPLHTTVSQPQSTNPTAGEEGVPLVEPKGTEEK